MPGKPDIIAVLDAEIREEIAASMGRVVGVMTRAMARCEALRPRIERAPPGPLRDGLLADFEKAYEEAKTYRYYAIVQREAMGLRYHEPFYEEYPLPRRPAE